VPREDSPVVARQHGGIVRRARVRRDAVWRHEKDPCTVVDGICVCARRHLGVWHAETGGDSGHGGGIPCGRMKARVEVADIVGEQRWLVVLGVHAHEEHARLLSGRQVGECRACLRKRRERGRTDVGAAGEAEEHQRPPAREECRIERLAVLVQKGDRGERVRWYELGRVIRRLGQSTLPAASDNRADGKRYNRDGADQQRACGHAEQRETGTWRGRDYPTSPTHPMTTRGFVRVPPCDASVADLIRFGAAEFERAGLAYGHGTETAVDDAAALVFHVLGLDHDRAAEAYGTRPNARERDAVLATFAERIRSRMPAAYLMGHMWFAGLEFEVDPRVIVPRSPFAELILAEFRPWVDPARVQRVLDLGTGSGCIAIACARALPESHVDAVDISPQALELAHRNVLRHDLADRVQLFGGDLYEPVAGRRYDMIVSNPPYVSDAEMAELPREYAHEPDLALRAGADGLDVVRRILAGAARHLEPDGTLFVEVGDSAARLVAAYPDLPFVWLEFEHGGGGVFLLTRADLEARHTAFALTE